VPVEQPYTLALRGRDGIPTLEARQDGTANALLTPNGGRGGIGVGAIAFHPTQDPISSTDGSTHCMGTGSSQGKATIAVAIRTANTSANGHGISPELSHTLDRAQGQAVAVTAQSMQVRRLTPVECERLQGFPDGYTDIPWTEYQRIQRRAEKAGTSFEAELRKHGKVLRGPTMPACPDGPRYKALGNSWAVPNVRWIGRRIQLAVEIAKTANDNRPAAGKAAA
jgi:DNA (cytosine-5)-methyltransferase 1